MSKLTEREKWLIEMTLANPYPSDINSFLSRRLTSTGRTVEEIFADDAPLNICEWRKIDDHYVTDCGQRIWNSPDDWRHQADTERPCYCKRDVRVKDEI